MLIWLNPFVTSDVILFIYNVQNHRVCSCFAGCSNKETGCILKELFQASYFRITVVPDGATVELCGALKVVYDSHLYLAITSYSCVVISDL